MPPILNIRHHIAWSYANLARAHMALTDGVTTYGRGHHMVRAKLFKRLVDGTMSMRSLYDDERVKLLAPRGCSYCGSPGPLTLDHLVPRIRGGSDEGDNLVRACRPCNSSKGDRDLLRWLLPRQRFPSVLMLRRYTKIAASWSSAQGIMDRPMSDLTLLDPPMALELLPYQLPALSELRLWAEPTTPTDSGSG